ncbi:MAG: Trk system potassium transporter TrkA [Syntrophomonadaceae bacterium]|nr:Trk system potassium transporter TrkA [Syntrophomonadaceae bacterium]
MRVVIVGAGKVGFNIAQMLSQESHDVIVIERDEERQRIVEENLDVQTIFGNGASVNVLENAKIREADLLVAVTEQDELNMVACLVAKNMGVPRTIARVRNPEYIDTATMAQAASLGIDLVINPEKVAAKAIAELVEVPEALAVEYYADGKVMLLELSLMPNNPIVNKKLRDLNFSYPYLIAAILRSGKIMVPRGDDLLLPYDHIFIVAETRLMKEIEKLLGSERAKIQSVFILGGGRLGFYLAKLLERKNLSIKLLEKDVNKCMEITNQLNKVMVLNGDGTDIHLLEQENVGKSDLFVAVTDDDKVNLLVSLLAKELGAKKTIAQIRRSDYISLVERVGIDVAISPRTLVASAILKYIRKGGIVSVSLWQGGGAETMEIIVPDHLAILGKPLQSYKFPRSALIGAIVRANKVIIPSGSDVLLAGDLIIVFALPEAVSKVEQFFADI